MVNWNCLEIYKKTSLFVKLVSIQGSENMSKFNNKPPKIVNVPFLPHLKKFVIKHYRLDDSLPIMVTKNSILGKLSHAILISKKNKVTTSSERHTEKIKLSFSQDINKLEIRINRLILLNNYYHKFFLEMMCMYIISQDRVGIPPWVAVEDFLKLYDIAPEEYDKYSAYRQWQRFKNEEFHQQNDLKVI